MLEVKLRVREGKNAGREIRLADAKFFIGRAEDCHLRPNSDMVSRHHCALLVDGDLVTIRDFGSKNGTYVDGERVAGERELTPGCSLRVGPLEFDVVISHMATAKKKPKVHSVKEAATRTVESASNPVEDDVSDWIESGEPAADDATRAVPGQTLVTDRDADTEEIQLGQTLAGRLPSSEGDAAGQEESEESSPDAPDADTREMPAPKAPKVKPGKLPPMPKSSSADSGSAASDALRKFLNRR